MAEGLKLIDKAVLKELIPPASLNAENFQELARKATLEELPAGRVIFKTGDQDGKNIYVLSGEVELLGDSGPEGGVRGGTPEARHPLSNFQPRQVTARTRTAVSLTRIDSDLLDILLTWDQLSGIEVIDITAGGRLGEDDAGDWMVRILQSKAFLRIPPANIQNMFMRLQELPVKAGQVVVKQGDQGDYYYIICRGKFSVVRESATGADVTLATLVDGGAFGEEALLADTTRNATVTAEGDGLLMRLSKDDFNELLKAPMLDEVDLAQAKHMVQSGATLMDVRMESEHATGSIKGSVNVPLYMLRLKAENLDPKGTYICYCETGRRSQAAAYLLSEAGFQSYTLKGGLQAVSEARNR